ncbi:hypothetical protein [Leptolyngbya ohadii]|nr:hypothetical protein [Leptolyngbya ohadii]
MISRIYGDRPALRGNGRSFFIALFPVPHSPVLTAILPEPDRFGRKQR